MAQTINTNVISLNAQRNVSSTQSLLSQSINRLSSGLRVNSARDDAAGLAIAERMNTQVRGMNVAIRNSMDGISLAQTAEGAIGKIGDMMQRMRELAVQSANGTNGTDDQANLDAEFDQLNAEITRTISTTKFNGKAVLGADNSVTFQVGANNGETVAITGVDLSGAFQTAMTALGVDSTANANAALTAIDAQLTVVNNARATWGAAQNRFDAIVSNLQISVENQSAARGRIMDADFAAETANLTRAQVLQQAGMAMLSQANAVPNNVLALLR